MNIDLSNVVKDARCYRLASSDELRAYNLNKTYYYELIGNKWVYNYETDNNYGNIFSYCLSYSDIEKIPSPVEWVEPFYYMAAAVSFCAILFLAYKIIIKPFFRGAV